MRLAVLSTIGFVIASLLLSDLATAQSVRLNWDAVTLDTSGQAEQIFGYEVAWGPSSGNYSSGNSSVTPNTALIDNLTNGQTYYFVAKAIDVGGNESAWSNEAEWTVPDEDCANLLDDDYDGLTDCQDSECGAGSETCDGFDNDCDGETDNGLSGLACPLQDGVCAGSQETCGGAGGWLPCTSGSYGSDYQASESRCDGLDNDCDGGTDDDLAPPACALQQGVCVGSRQRCGGASGWLACSAQDYGADYEATEASCDDLDNDCDGSTDEGVNACCTEGETVPCSSEQGECRAGVQTCDAQGMWGECDGVMPADEVCDGLDNDCDNSTDEDLGGPACPLQDGVCAGSSQRCDGANGWLACSGADYGADYEQEETRCDGLDNDCDSQTDEGDICQQTDGGTDGGADGGADAGLTDDDKVVISGGCACGRTGAADATGLGLIAIGLAVFLSRRKRRGDG